MSNTLDYEKKIKNQFEVIKRIDTYIITTNTKCTIIMSYCAAATAFIFTLLAKLDLEKASMPLLVGIGIFSTLALILALCCMVQATLTIFPITSSKPNTPKGESLIFYGDITSCNNGEDYSQKIERVSDADFLSDLNGQIFTLATIASDKFSRIQSISVVLIIHFACMAAVLAGAVIYHL